mmetsp:Transcript_72388/g.212412  ORF Transcript_72388/g.212412 Transcript_72388/m.212412 type:complete len:236 (+) Transcript_72388:72-779(+)
MSRHAERGQAAFSLRRAVLFQLPTRSRAAFATSGLPWCRMLLTAFPIFVDRRRSLIGARFSRSWSPLRTGSATEAGGRRTGSPSPPSRKPHGARTSTAHFTSVSSSMRARLFSSLFASTTRCFTSLWPSEPLLLSFTPVDAFISSFRRRWIASPAIPFALSSIVRRSGPKRPSSALNKSLIVISWMSIVETNWVTKALIWLVGGSITSEWSCAKASKAATSKPPSHFSMPGFGAE